LAKCFDERAHVVVAFGKCSHIVPNGEGWQDAVTLALEQHTAAIIVSLDGSDAAPVKQLPAENAAAGSCK